MAWVDYQEYLKSHRWRAMRLWALSRAGNRCEVCGNENGLEVHHRSYENLGCEFPGELLVLCEDCHEAYGLELINDIDARVRALKDRVVAEPDPEKQLALLADLHELTQERCAQIKARGRPELIQVTISGDSR